MKRGEDERGQYFITEKGTGRCWECRNHFQPGDKIYTGKYSRSICRHCKNAREVVKDL